MPELKPERCNTKGIPYRLHTNGRSKHKNLSSEDRFFLRHPPIINQVGYGFEIPQFRLTRQSGNSEQINLNGKIRDVLYDTKEGKHHKDFQIASLPLKDISNLSIPNPNSNTKNNKGAVIKPADIYSFEVVHEPTSCMYPHCEIITNKNGNPVKDVSSPLVKSTIRLKMAEIADLHRESFKSELETENHKFNPKTKYWVKKLLSITDRFPALNSLISV